MMMSDNSLSHRLTAQSQCDFIDRHLNRAAAAAERQQHRLLVAGSQKNHARMGLAAAQVPRCVNWGLTLGRYPTTAIRDVLLAVTSVVVDDQIVAPLVRIGRRAHTQVPLRHQRGVAADAYPEAQERHKRRHHPNGSLRLYENALVLMWSTGQAVLAAPLNAAVLASATLGAAVGLCAGTVMAVLVGLLAPRELLCHLCPSLAVLTLLTQNCELMQLDERTRNRARAEPQNAWLQRRSHALWQEVKRQLEINNASIAALCPDENYQQVARKLDAKLLASPKARRFIGLGEYPAGNIDRLLQAQSDYERLPPPSLPENEKIVVDDADGAVGI